MNKKRIWATFWAFICYSAAAVLTTKPPWGFLAAGFFATMGTANMVGVDDE